MNPQSVRYIYIYFKYIFPPPWLYKSKHIIYNLQHNISHQTEKNVQQTTNSKINNNSHAFRHKKTLFERQIFLKKTIST